MLAIDEAERDGQARAVDSRIVECVPDDLLRLGETPQPRPGSACGPGSPEGRTGIPAGPGPKLCRPPRFALASSRRPPRDRGPHPSWAGGSGVRSASARPSRAGLPRAPPRPPRWPSAGAGVPTISSRPGAFPRRWRPATAPASIATRPCSSPSPIMTSRSRRTRPSAAAIQFGTSGHQSAMRAIYRRP